MPAWPAHAVRTLPFRLIGLAGFGGFPQHKIERILFCTSNCHTLARAEFVYSLVRAEGPVAIPTVAVRLCRAAGLSRAGKQIQRIADDSIALLSNAGKVEEKGGFLWLEGMEVQCCP